jgi:hypothetical protein
VEAGASIPWRVRDEVLLCAEKHGRLTVSDKRIEIAVTGFRDTTSPLTSFDWSINATKPIKSTSGCQLR